jgi:hypothetical protein
MSGEERELKHQKRLERYDGLVSFDRDEIDDL